MIHLNNVTKTYPNGSRGVEDISLHIQKGEFVFIVGSSGSGKSTLIKLLLKELDPTSGDIIINRVKTNELSRNQVPYLRRNLGVVFQDFRLLPNKTVYENVAFAMRVIEAPSRIIRRNVPAVLALVGLGKKGRSYPNQLSGGEQQRTALSSITRRYSFVMSLPATLIRKLPGALCSFWTISINAARPLLWQHMPAILWTICRNAL